MPWVLISKVPQPAHGAWEPSPGALGFLPPQDVCEMVLGHPTGIPVLHTGQGCEKHRAKPPCDVPLLSELQFNVRTVQDYTVQFSSTQHFSPNGSNEN